MQFLELIQDRRFKKLVEQNLHIDLWFNDFASDILTFGYNIDEYYFRNGTMPYSNYYTRFGNLLKRFKTDKEIKKIDVGCSGAGFEATFYTDNEEYNTVDKFFEPMRILERC